MSKADQDQPKPPRVATANDICEAMMSGWDPERAEIKPGFFTALKNRLYAFTLGEFERHDSLIPNPDGSSRGKVDNFGHFMERALIYAEKHAGENIPNIGVLEEVHVVETPARTPGGPSRGQGHRR